MNRIDRPDRRDWDVSKSFRQFVYPAIAAYFILTLGAVAVAELTTRANLPILFVGGLCAGFACVGAAVRVQRRQMVESQAGYNIQDGGKPFFVLGTREYTRYRIDRGLLQGMTLGRTPYRDKLDKRARVQREMHCEVCADEIGRGGGYFVETRSISRLFGYPVREKILDTDAYCLDHKPRDFQ